MASVVPSKKRMLMASVVAVAAASVTQVSVGFVSPSVVSCKGSSTCTSSLKMSSAEEDMSLATTTSRRGMMSSLATVFGAAVTVTATSTKPAEATYSAYAAREKDWQERMEKGEIKVTSAKQLRKQLAEIAPMNNEGKMMFCPNGPSAAVTPMMENMCGERLAMPSVYGRTQDIVGNSIPGFNGGKYPSQIPGGGVGTLNAGGFDGAGAFPASVV